MRINIYSQELITNDNETDDLTVVARHGHRSNTGVYYSAVRLHLHSSPHATEGDDRSAITFWLPKSSEHREYIACCFENLATLVRLAEPEEGID